MQRQEPTVFRDKFGQLRDGWEFLILIALIAVALVVIVSALLFGAYKPLAESGCNQRASELGVVDGDYRLMSDACYLTLDTGEGIPADQYRAVEGVER